MTVSKGSCHKERPFGTAGSLAVVANRIRVRGARYRFDQSALLLGAIQFYHEALHVEGLRAGCEGRGGQL